MVENPFETLLAAMRKVVPEPTMDDLWAKIQTMQAQILFLKGLAIGAGIADVDERLDEIAEEW